MKICDENCYSLKSSYPL